MEMAKLFEDSCHEMLRKVFPDRPEMRERLTPDYAFGCKRLIASDDFFPSFARDNCTLETRPIDQIIAKGVRLQDGAEEEHDLLVFATGFRTLEFMYPIQVKGRQGRPLADVWKGGATAYHGITVEDMPNFGMCYGPNTNLGHNSIILMIEAESKYLSGLIEPVLEAKRSGTRISLRPKAERVDAFNAQIQKSLNASAFADPQCNSWYKNADGRVTNNWPETVVQYQKNLSEIRWDEYEAEGPGKHILDGRPPAKLGRVREESYFSNKTLVIGAVSVVVAAGALFLGGHIDLRRRFRGR